MDIKNNIHNSSQELARRVGVSLLLNGSQDEDEIRFDGEGVDPVFMDSDDEDDDDEPNFGPPSDVDDALESDQINYMYLISPVRATILSELIYDV